MDLDGYKNERKELFCGKYHPEKYIIHAYWKKAMTDKSMATTKVQFGEPMSFIELFYKTPPWVTTYKGHISELSGKLNIWESVFSR